jgi:hypothetical protein
MSFSPALHTFQAFDLAFPEPLPRREFPRKAPRSSPPAWAQSSSDHPVLFMVGLLFATSLAVTGLWQGLSLLLPH